MQKNHQSPVLVSDYMYVIHIKTHCVAQEAGVPLCDYIDRKKTQFSHICSSYPIETKFGTEVPV